MSAEIDELKKQVTANTSLNSSAIELLVGLAKRLADLKNDPVAIAALSQELKDSAAALSSAIVANTPEPPVA